MGNARSIAKRSLIPLLLAVAGAVACGLLLPSEKAAIESHLRGFPDADAAAHHARLWIVAALCFLPAAAAACYQLGTTLDRYITRQFATIFAICTCGLFAIWLLMDLTDNASEFRASTHPLATLGSYYATRFPAILLLLTPFSLLLALLYAMGKLSTHREIISMVQAGRSVPRIALPLVVSSVFCALFCLGLNYHWAPVADGLQDNILSQGKGQAATAATRVVYRDPASHRIWMIREFPSDYEKGTPLRKVEVTLSRADGKTDTILNADTAQWDERTRHWTFTQAKVWHFNNMTEPPDLVAPPEPIVVKSWAETPWQLIKPGLSPAYLGIPGLDTWLKTYRKNPSVSDPAPYRTHWHYRWALPFGCIVTVLIATPLSIHFSRRGSGGGIFFAILLSALMMLSGHISLAFGEAGHIPPVLAAWLPNILFSLTGLYLFRRRILGKPIYRTMRPFIPVST